MFESVATLYSSVTSQDEYGNIIDNYSTSTVYVKPRSVHANEFYNASTTGLKPEVVLVISTPADYHGEELVEYKGIKYEVIRVYQDGMRIELTLQRRMEHE